MLVFTSTTDPRISSLPPPYQPPTLTAVRTLTEVFGHEPDSQAEGFVAFIEATDTPESATSAFARRIASVESVFRDGPCLIGVLLWGNDGDGVTIVCPDEHGYAPEIADILTKHLGPKGTHI